MKKIQRRAGLLAAVSLLCALLLSGCKDMSLGEMFDETQVLQKSRDAIDYFNGGDYQAIIDMGGEALKGQLTVEDFDAQAAPKKEKLGAFKEITREEVMGTVDEETGMNYAGTVTVAKYEHGKLKFTIAYDEDMNLVQFTIK